MHLELTDEQTERSGLTSAKASSRAFQASSSPPAMAGRSQPGQLRLLPEMTGSWSWQYRCSSPVTIGSAGTSCRSIPTGPRVNIPSPSDR